LNSYRNRTGKAVTGQSAGDADNDNSQRRWNFGSTNSGFGIIWHALKLVRDPDRWSGPNQWESLEEMQQEGQAYTKGPERKPRAFNCRFFFRPDQLAG
jgi:hypothetical protein